MASAGAVFQDGLFDPSRLVQRALADGGVVRLRLEPLGGGRVRVLDYHRKPRGGAWRRCPEEERRVLDYAKLGLERPYEELFACSSSDAPEPSS